jgi:hypothetical protein
MGKRKTQAEEPKVAERPPAEPEAQEGGAKKGEKKARVVAYLQEHGADTPNATVVAWYAEKFPGETITPATVSQARKALTGQEGPPRASRRGQAVPVANAEPTVSDILKVTGLAADHEGGLDGLAAMIEDVEKVAAEVGGLSRLKACVEAIRKIKEA